MEDLSFNNMAQGSAGPRLGEHSSAFVQVEELGSTQCRVPYFAFQDEDLDNLGEPFVEGARVHPHKERKVTRLEMWMGM
jgi:hypothetical protein